MPTTSEPIDIPDVDTVGPFAPVSAVPLRVPSPATVPLLWMATLSPVVHRLLSGGGLHTPSHDPAVTEAEIDAILDVVPPENVTEPPTNSCAVVERMIDLGFSGTGL